MAKLKASKEKKARHDRYAKESRAEKNRVKALKSHLAKHPEDTKAQAALNRAGTPKTKSMGRNQTKPNREKSYVDASGKSVGAPAFRPQMVFDENTKTYHLNRSIGADWYKANQGSTK